MSEQVTFQLRRGNSTTTNGITGWKDVNPVLSSGEPGFELDTTTLKIGDSSTNWNNLSKLRFGSEIAIGRDSALIGQGTNSISIGYRAGMGYENTLINLGPLIPPTTVPVAYPQENNTIILNASGNYLGGVSGQTGSYYVAPIRNTSGVTGLMPLSYNTETKEVLTTGLSGTVITGSILPTQDSLFNLGSPTQRFNNIYANSAIISTQTVYMVLPGSTGIPTASISFYNGIFLMADNSSKNLMSIGPSGFQNLDYNTYFGPDGILGPPPGSTFADYYKFLGVTQFNGGLPDSIPNYIVNGGRPSSTYTYSINANNSQGATFYS